MSSFHAVPASDLELLRTFDTPTVCNVIELLDCRPRTAGYLDGRIRACFPHLPPVVGYAATATFRAAAPPRSGDVYAGLEQQEWIGLRVDVSKRLLRVEVTDGGPGFATEVPGLRMYHAAFTSGEMGYASSVGLVLFVLCLGLTLVINRGWTAARPL